MYNKLAVFKKELAKVENLTIRKFAEKVISNIPDYFFEIAASSTGKYHPSYALGDGGLVRHTKAAVSIAIDLTNLEHNAKLYNSDERDCIIVSLICHDGWKHGDMFSPYTIANHPVVAAEHVIELADEEEKQFAKVIADNIRSHMGEWNTNYKSKETIMPKPQTHSEIFVHECDYLASRKYLICEFSDYYQPQNFVLKEKTDVKKKIDELIVLCKDKIAKGIDRNEIYRIIAEKNGGKKNPNTITDISTINEITDIIIGLKENN